MHGGGILSGFNRRKRRPASEASPSGNVPFQKNALFGLPDNLRFVKHRVLLLLSVKCFSYKPIFNCHFSNNSFFPSGSCRPAEIVCAFRRRGLKRMKGHRSTPQYFSRPAKFGFPLKLGGAGSNRTAEKQGVRGVHINQAQHRAAGRTQKTKEAWENPVEKFKEMIYKQAVEESEMRKAKNPAALCCA